MEQPNSPQEPPHPAPPQEESIFQESDYSMEGYDKHIRNARNMLFIVAAVELVSGLFSVQDLGDPAKTISIAIVVGVAAIFASLAFWTKKKPFPALLTALILYASLLIVEAISEPSSIIKGIILKVAIIVSLISGISNAKEAEDLKKTFGKNQ